MSTMQSRELIWPFVNLSKLWKKKWRSCWGWVCAASWGEMVTFGSFQRGLSFGRGSSSKTSRKADFKYFSFKASTKSLSLTIEPLPTFLVPSKKTKRISQETHPRLWTLFCLCKVWTKTSLEGEWCGECEGGCWQDNPHSSTLQEFFPLCCGKCGCSQNESTTLLQKDSSQNESITLLQKDSSQNESTFLLQEDSSWTRSSSSQKTYTFWPNEFLFHLSREFPHSTRSTFCTLHSNSKHIPLPKNSKNLYTFFKIQRKSQKRFLRLFFSHWRSPLSWANIASNTYSEMWAPKRPKRVKVKLEETIFCSQNFSTPAQLLWTHSLHFQNQKDFTFRKCFFLFFFYSFSLFLERNFERWMGSPKATWYSSSSFSPSSLKVKVKPSFSRICLYFSLEKSFSNLETSLHVTKSFLCLISFFLASRQKHQPFPTSWIFQFFRSNKLW